MRRRQAILLLASAILWSPAATGQTRNLPIIGALSARSEADSAHAVDAFRHGLANSGYIDGRNCAIDFRWANGRYDRLPALAAELVQRRVSVLATFGGNEAAAAAKAATSTIPIVFAIGGDPVEAGLVRRLNRPEGNVTGATFLTAFIDSKRLGLLHETFPGVASMGLLVNPARPGIAAGQTADARQAARAFAIDLVVENATTAADIDAAFADLARRRIGGLVVAADPFFDTQRGRLVALPARLRIPTIYQFRDYALAGGLMSYGARIADAYRQVGIYVGRILKGAKPGDLPVVQPVNFDLVINLKAAKALGLAIPQSVLLRANEVIE